MKLDIRSQREIKAMKINRGYFVFLSICVIVLIDVNQFRKRPSFHGLFFFAKKLLVLFEGLSITCFQFSPLTCLRR